MPESISTRNPAAEPSLSAARVVDGEVEVSWENGAPAGRFSPMHRWPRRAQELRAQEAHPMSEPFREPMRSAPWAA